MDKNFVMELLKASINPELLHEIGNCTWESKTQTLTTSEDTEDNKAIARENASQYKDKFAVFNQGKTRGKKQYVNPDVLHYLDG